MIFRFLILFSILILILSSCEKTYDSITMPSATVTGQNTLGCFINDSIYIPYAKFGWRRRLEFVSNYNTNDSSFQLQTLNIKHFNYLNHVHINIGKVYKVGTYPLVDAQIYTYGSPDLICYYRSNKSGICTFWLDSTLNKNQVKITNFDTVNKTISGEFNFVAVSHDSIDTVVVKNGRFDSQWNYDFR